MAFLFCDSFDHYDTANLFAKWTSFVSTTIVAAAGRRSTQSIRLINNSSWPTRGLNPGDNTIICGAAYKATVLGLHEIFLVQHNGSNQLSICLNASGGIDVRRGDDSGVVLGSTAAGLILTSTYYFIEMKALISTTVGTVEIRINGTVVLTLTGLNSALAATNLWNSIGMKGLASSNIDYDDFYVLDGTGPAPWNTYLGDIRIDVCLPTAEGTTTQWTPSTGTDNALTVDEIPPNSDTDYNSTVTVNNVDTLVVANAPVVGATILAVQQNTFVKKSDAGTAAFAVVVRSGSTDYVQSTVTPGTTYVYAFQPLPTDPNTSAAWTEAAFNAAEFGYKRIA